ncbi:MAG: hypothetical protein VBE63_14260 [Lamprobacter sp.]|uniref:sulfotransferase domain-containing protein n=1 Tax=Lamprobacter sp. TaxID=3100796 RepID=UPI002B2597FD|nr:sulfotransferase domain-containing protein [Lamprobacter sp.]MEA3641087.1 hypothetical protein [Lamprobacter sp.]
MSALIDSKIALRSNLIRKGIALALQAPRTLKRWTATSDEYGKNPPIIVNSIPKSGTHLLMQAARALPNTQYYGSFVAWSSSLTLKKRSDQEMLRRLSRIVPGEVVGAHLHYSTAVKEQLCRQNAIHWLIIRDPMDVLLSEAHYLRSMNRFHRMAREFRSLDQNESIRRALEGSPNRPDLYPSLEKRLRPYLDWIKDTDCIIVRYEDFLEPFRCESEIRRLLHSWLEPARVDPPSIAHLTNNLMAALDPAKSHTVSRRQKASEAPLRQRLGQNEGLNRLRREMGYDEHVTSHDETADSA